MNKENNIEESIKILEEIKANCIDKGKTYYEDDKRVKKVQAIETIIEAYNRQKEINEEHQKINSELQQRITKYEMKVKDIINFIDNDNTYFEDGESYQNVLQIKEMLEEGE